MPNAAAPADRPGRLDSSFVQSNFALKLLFNRSSSPAALSTPISYRYWLSSCKNSHTNLTPPRVVFRLYLRYNGALLSYLIPPIWHHDKVALRFLSTKLLWRPENSIAPKMHPSLISWNILRFISALKRFYDFSTTSVLDPHMLVDY